MMGDEPTAMKMRSRASPPGFPNRFTVRISSSPSCGTCPHLQAERAAAEARDAEGGLLGEGGEAFTLGAAEQGTAITAVGTGTPVEVLEIGKP